MGSCLKKWPKENSSCNVFFWGFMHYLTPILQCSSNGSDYSVKCCRAGKCLRMSWKLIFWKSEFMLYLKGRRGLPVTSVNGKVKISSPSLTPSALALGERDVCMFSCYHMIQLHLRSKYIQFCRLHAWSFSRQDWIKPWATWLDPLADPVVCWRWDYTVVPSYVSYPTLSSWIAHPKIRRSHFHQKWLVSPQKWNLKTATLPQTHRPQMNERGPGSFSWETVTLVFQLLVTWCSHKINCDFLHCLI